MSSVATSTNSQQILFSESLSPWTRHVLEASKAYQTMILLYEDDLTGNVMAAWAESDRLKLKIQRIGQVANGVGVCTFGMDPFPPNTVVELHLRDASQDSSRQDAQRSAYKSLLNELILIQVKVFTGQAGEGHLK
jgi:hypothetical protein